MYLTDTYVKFHPNTTEYTFFLAAPGTFYKIGYILGYKAYFDKYKKLK